MRHALDEDVWQRSSRYRSPGMYVQIDLLRSATEERDRLGRETRDVGERAKVEAMPRNGELENTFFSLRGR